MIGFAKKILDPDSEFAPVIQRIFRMSLEGSGAKEIASIFNSEGICQRSEADPLCRIHPSVCIGAPTAACHGPMSYQSICIVQHSRTGVM